MIVLYGVCAAAGGIFLLWAQKQKGERKILEQAGWLLYRKIVCLVSRLNKYIPAAGGYEKGFLEEKEKKIAEELSLLCPGGEKRQQAVSYVERCTGEVFAVLWICTVLAFGLSAGSVCAEKEAEREYITRNAAGKGSREEMLVAESGDIREEIQFQVASRAYTEEEKEALFQQFLPLLEEILLAENSSPDAVRKPLCLAEQIAGFPFRIAWEYEEKGVILPDGSLENEKLEENGVVTKLCAVISDETFRREYELALRVLPPVYSGKEQWKQKLRQALAEKEQTDRTKEKVWLPGEIEGKPIRWLEKREDNSLFVWLAGPLCGILLFWGREQERKKQLAGRERELELLYPELVTRMALLLGAGMTVRAAVRKMASEGEAVWGVLDGELRAVCYEMDAGISEGQAYQHFGRRCQKKQYKKLAALLSQNLKKGSRGLLPQMLQEAKEALEEQKNAVRRLGEEAGTKLLVPMTGMLIVTMLLVIVPAMGSFGI